MGLQVPAVLLETHGFMVQVWVKPATGMGFAGTGAGWTSHTCIGLLTSIRYTRVLESGTRGKTRETRTRGYQVPGS